MLRLLPPPGEGQDPPAKRPRRPAVSLSLTADETRCLRASARGIARSYGSLAGLARALGINPAVLTRKRRQSPALAVALWRLTKIPVEALLTGKLAAVQAPATGSGGAA